MTTRTTAHEPWPAALIFDLDGTLVDSAPDIAAAVERAQQRLEGAGEGAREGALVGAPVDYHDNGVLGERYKALARAGHWTHDKTGLTAHHIPPTLLRSPGVLNSLVFKATSPMAAVRSYAGLAANLHDEAYVSNHATNAAFLDDMVAYPGGVVADFIDYLWIDNVLGEGRLPMSDPPADLSHVQAPILNISGRGDPIVTPSCSQAMTRIAVVEGFQAGSQMRPPWMAIQSVTSARALALARSVPASRMCRNQRNPCRASVQALLDTSRRKGDSPPASTTWPASAKRPA